MQEITIPLTQPGTFLLDDITYRQTRYWFDNIFRDLRMSIVQPWGKPGQRCPVILWICGGGWQTMDRNAWLSELSWFAKHGWAVASPEYRTSNEKPFPAALYDIKAAIRYLRAHAEQYGFDPERIVLMGESAGGHLAALAGTSGDCSGFWEDGDPGVSERVKAVVDWYGPVSETFLGENLHAAVMAEGADPGVLSPLSYLGKDTPPFLLLHGTDDTVVPIEESEKFCRALEEQGVPVRFYTIRGAGHATRHFHQEEIKRLILDFLEEAVRN